MPPISCALGPAMIKPIARWSGAAGRALLAFAFIMRVRALLKYRTQSEVRVQLRNEDLDWAKHWRAAQIVRAVQRGAWLAPEASCLVQAIATEALLRRAGLEPEIRVGVEPAGAGRFRAHAWVMLDGRPVIGGSEKMLMRYTALTTLK